MAKQGYVRVLDGKVVEITELQLGPEYPQTPDAWFGALPGAWLKCDDPAIHAGMLYADGKFTAAAADPAAIALAIRADCRRRITEKVSETTQRNLIAYGVQLLSATIGKTLDALSDGQKADLAAAEGIVNWVNADGGMLATCRALVAAADTGYGDDEKWPEWSTDWDALVARF